MICDRFCTVNCVDGSCPIALSEEYAERGIPVVVYSCNECAYHTSCDDCDWQGTDMCGRMTRQKMVHRSTENQIMKKPRKVAKPKSNDLLTAVNRAFNDGYEKALKDLNNDHVITYEQARNYITAQHDRTNKI